MKRHLLTAAILVGALALDVIGMSGGCSVLLLAGAALELPFWVRAMQGRRQEIPAGPWAKP